MVLKNTRLVKIFIFSSYYNVNGISMARRYWKIPSSSFEVEAIPPPPSASPPEVGSIASTSQDSEGIFQYLLAMLMPLLHCIRVNVVSYTNSSHNIFRYHTWHSYQYKHRYRLKNVNRFLL